MIEFRVHACLSWAHSQAFPSSVSFPTSGNSAVSSVVLWYYYRHPFTKLRAPWQERWEHLETAFHLAVEWWCISGAAFLELGNRGRTERHLQVCSWSIFVCATWKCSIRLHLETGKGGRLTVQRHKDKKDPRSNHARFQNAWCVCESVGDRHCYWKTTA